MALEYNFSVHPFSKPIGAPVGPTFAFYYCPGSQPCTAPAARDVDGFVTAKLRSIRVHFEGIAANYSWSWGCVATVDHAGRTIWIVDAHHDDGKRFTVRADEKLKAFVELKSAIGVCSELS